MTRSQITVTRGLALLIPIMSSLVALLGQGCGQSTPAVIEKVVKETQVVEKEIEVTREVPLLPIPLSLNPSKTFLNPGDQVVISVVSEEWQAAELTWELDSASKELLSPDTLSASTGPVIIYTAPKGSGEVIVSVKGRTEAGEGRGSVSFTIEPSLGGVVKFWTPPSKIDWDLEREMEFRQLYPDVLVEIVSLPSVDVPERLEAAIAAGTAPDVVRFPGIDTARVFGENGLLAADTATGIVRKIGEEKFNPELLEALHDPVDEARWLAIPATRGMVLGVIASAANKRIAVEWVTFLAEAEISVAVTFGGPPFDDLRVQEAILHAVPWVELTEQTFPNQDIPVTVYREGKQFIEDAREMPFDPEKALVLLAEAGFADGFRLSLLFTPEDDSMAKMAQIMTEEFFSEIGIEVDFITVSTFDAPGKISDEIEYGQAVLWLSR